MKLITQIHVSLHIYLFFISYRDGVGMPIFIILKYNNKKKKYYKHNKIKLF